MKAYDENDEQIHMKDLDSQSLIVKNQEGDVNIGYIAPGGKSVYAAEVNINPDYAEYEAIPSRMEFSLKNPKWGNAEKSDCLEVVDFTEYGDYYDTEKLYWSNEIEDMVYEGIETRETVSITVKNTGDQNYELTDAHGFAVTAVYRDGDGNVVGAAIADLGINGDIPGEMTIPAGEEVCFDTSSISYTPHESVELFVTYYDFEP